MFQTGDRIVRVEHGGSRSRMISWRIWHDAGARWQFQQESTDEQNFSLIPSNFAPLILVAKVSKLSFQYELDENFFFFFKV